MLQFFATHYQTFITGGVVIYLAYKELFAGTSKRKDDIIETSEKRIKQLESECLLKDEANEECNAKREVAEKTVVAREATIVEKDIQIKALKEDLAYRNPDLVKVLENTARLIEQNFEVNKEVLKFMKSTAMEAQKTSKVVERINHEMTKQTDMLIETKERSNKIDEASKEHTGEPIRIPINNSNKN